MALKLLPLFLSKKVFAAVTATSVAVGAHTLTSPESVGEKDLVLKLISEEGKTVYVEVDQDGHPHVLVEPWSPCIKKESAYEKHAVELISQEEIPAYISALDSNVRTFHEKLLHLSIDTPNLPEEEMSLDQIEEALAVIENSINNTDFDWEARNGNTPLLSFGILNSCDPEWGLRNWHGSLLADHKHLIISIKLANHEGPLCDRLETAVQEFDEYCPSKRNQEIAHEEFRHAGYE